MKALKNADKLIVAYDPDPDDFTSVDEVQTAVINFAESIEGSGVYIKVNYVLRLLGLPLIMQLHDRGLKVFADLKLNDISNTMLRDAKFLNMFAPEMVTVMCSSGVDGMRVVQETLPDTKVLGVTVLTSFDESNCISVYDCTPKVGVLRLAKLAIDAKIAGIVLSPKETEALKEEYGDCLPSELVIPGIRPKFTLVKGDDQSRVTTPRQAIAGGGTRIVVGRPITQAENPSDAITRIVDEINFGLADLGLQ